MKLEEQLMVQVQMAGYTSMVMITTTQMAAGEMNYTEYVTLCHN